MRALIKLLLAAALVVMGNTWAEAAGLKLKESATITQSTVIAPGVYRMADVSGAGALRIKGDNLVVDLQGAQLDGSKPGQAPDEFTGTGIFIEGRNITLKRAQVRGYKVGIHALRCPGLVIEDVEVSGNYQKRLLSTPEAEEGSDWIFGHENDRREWLENYGMGLYIERSDNVTVRRVKAWHGQNGIGIDRVANSKFYDNDCSFLSGWGFAMWRSDTNVISRNAFDFCIRGYSHGVYNRGQDSAGIFMFEQNHGNVIAENSATHDGDGFFGFAGKEALGENQAPEGFHHKRAGNNDNLLIGNDFSYASAHGIEMTFGFGNRFLDNRVVGNCICGVWGGLSQDTLIAGNGFEDNGEMGYGLERGGVNIDSGRRNRIVGNTFLNNRCGVHLWGPPTAEFLKTPWGAANQPASADTVIASNVFKGDRVVLHLRGTNENIVYARNVVENAGQEFELAKGNQVVTELGDQADWQRPAYPVYGETRPVGGRQHLAGRWNILMTEWGPYDYTAPMVYPDKISGYTKATFRVLGPGGEYTLSDLKGRVQFTPKSGPLPAVVTVSSTEPGLREFSAQVNVGKAKFKVGGTLLNAQWQVDFYGWNANEDPRDKAGNWAQILSRPPLVSKTVNRIDFKWGMGAPDPRVGADHFATVASTSIALPAGKYRMRTISDDGLRVFVDGKKVIEDWTWHAPKSNDAEIALDGGAHAVRIEHFEIDGFAQLQWRIEPAR
jgi:hypothetical protein